MPLTRCRKSFRSAAPGARRSATCEPIACATASNCADARMPRGKGEVGRGRAMRMPDLFAALPCIPALRPCESGSARSEGWWLHLSSV